MVLYFTAGEEVHAQYTLNEQLIKKIMGVHCEHFMVVEVYYYVTSIQILPGDPDRLEQFLIY